jgi:uncharacterized repeat protein (TIGR01451 family)
MARPSSGADLDIRKTVDNPSPNQGDAVRWTVNVTNNGPETATDVIVYDTLPGGLRHTGDNATVGEYDENIGQWYIGELPSGASATLNIESIIETVGSMQTNSATVAGSSVDPNPDNNSDSASTHAVSADVRIVKTVSEHSPEVGEEVSWTISVINDGPDTATTVKVNDMLPEGVRHLLDNATIGDYDESTGEWFIGDLWSGGTATLVINTLVTDANLVQNNTATVSSGNFDPNLDNNTATASIYATGEAADLNVDKTVSETHPEVGEQITWTVVLTNEGPNTATNVILTDNLPPGVTLVSSSTTHGKFDPVTGEWCVDDLAPGASQTLTLVTTVDESYTQTNHAFVESDTFDPDPDDNADSATIHGGRADLSVDKVVDNSTPALGETVTWTITVHNSGPNDATGVNVRDELPAGLRLESEDATTGFYDLDRDQWWIGDLAAGATETLTITTTVVDAASAIQNTSTVVSRTEDPDESNNTSSATTDAESADLQLVKSVSDESPNVGDEITWSMTVTNLGPDTAVNTVVFDNLPNGVEHVSDTATIGEYDEDTGTWTLGDLASGESHTLEITTVVTDSDLQMNMALALSDTHDPDDCNNHDFAITDADVAADLSVQKTVDQATPNLGDDVTWSIVVANLGPDTAENVVLNDTLPAGVTLVSHDAEVGTFDEATGLWSIGDLASGATVTLQAITTVTDPDAQVNTSTVSSDTFDFNPDNNSDDAEVDAVLADLTVEKTVDNATPDAGESVTWTIVASNNGPDVSIGTQVMDVLPDGVTLLSSVAQGGNFVAATGLWDIGELASGDSVTLTLVTSVDDPAVAQVNTATISSDTFDPDETNNEDEAVVDAVAADLAVEKSVDNATPDAGESVEWTIVASNNGPDVALGVEVEDVLPDGVTLVDAVAETGDFDAATGLWTIGELASGESVMLVLETTVDDPAGAQVNTSTISSDTFDPDDSNNSDEESVDAVAADLSVVKSVDNETPDVGESVIWTVEVSNNGPDGASGVLVEDVLPAGVSLQTALANTGSYDEAAGLWTVGELDSGETATLIMITTVDDPSTAQVNVSTVSSDTFDPDDTNNEDDASVDAVAADIELVKSVDNEAPAVGESVTWQIEVSNTGPDDATGVSVSDVLPAEVTFDSAAASVGSFDDATGVWEIGDLASGETVSLELTTVVDEAGSIVNHAQVATADQVDPDSTPGNNQADEDDQDSATIEAAEAGPMATDNDYSVPVSGAQNLNAFMVIDRSSSMDAEVTLADGTTKTRLEVTRDAVKEFAAREQVTAVKVVAFDRDTVAVGTDADNPDEVSGWFDVTTTEGKNALDAFVDNLSLGAGTNYEAAIDASMTYFGIDGEGNADPLPDAAATNYYFLSDGEPSVGGEPGTNLLSDTQLATWQSFVDDNFDTSVAVGFGGGISRFDALEQVAHEPGTAGDDPDVEGDEPLALVVDEADDLPSGLLELISESVSGNVLDDDTGDGVDGPAGTGIRIESMQIDGETYSFDGSDITASALPLTAVIDGSTLNIPTAGGGRLEFDFASGAFEYLASTTIGSESFDYTIVDADGKTDSATVELDTIDPSAAVLKVAALSEPVDSVIEFGDLLASGDAELEWAAAANDAPAAVPAPYADVALFEGPLLPCDCDLPAVY